MEDDEDYREVLEKSRFEIVQRLQLDRSSLFDYLRSKGVFDASDCEIVLSEKTREQKASKFLDILQTKGKDGLIYFLDILQLLNPGLYQCITGKKANPCRIWENMRDKFAIGNCSQVPDVELLSGQLKRTIDDLQDLALRNQQLLKENHNLGMKLDQASTDLDLKHRRVEVLEKQKNDSERGVLEVHSNANRLSEFVTQQLRVLQQGLFERNTYIIALQMKLLATEEEIKESRRVQDELRVSNEMMSAKWQELSRNYDHERRESMKLSAKLKSQKGNLKKEFKQINQKMMDERDESLSKLEDLIDWTEALKARYDLVEQEYQQVQQNFVSAATENSKLKEENEELRLQLSLSKIRVSDLKGWNADLEETVKQYRDQRDYFSEARNAALTERDEIHKELEVAISRCKEKVLDREAMITKQTQLAKHFEEKYEKACTQVKTLQQRNTTAEQQLEELRLKRVKANSCATQTLDIIDTGEENPEASPPDPNTDPIEQIKGYPWKHRRDVSEIMQSVRKRVTGQHNKAMSLDRSLDMLKVDGSLSQEAKKCLSLQGGNLLFKTPPTYSLLRVMFGLSVGGHLGSLPDLSGDQEEGEKHEGTDTTDSASPDDELGAFDRSIDLEYDEVNHNSNQGQFTTNTNTAEEPKLRRSFTKSFSSPNMKTPHELRISGNGKDKSQDNEDEDFHWVTAHEWDKAQLAVNVKPKGKSRSPAFRQRAWAIKKKGQRSTSEPAILFPCNQSEDVEIPGQETTDR